ncbi:MAG: 3'(2'),5'-bisphosphate nucleotidase CysQ [Lentisphaeraceae bacterium]|nr:3'(2'),5'-bisphosphate nucleotidase CysQ [Lentisphaeraceae bacterium]
METDIKEKIRERGQAAYEFSYKCAQIARDFLGKSKTWNKNDSSPVTEADLAIDLYLQKSIKEMFPNDAIMSEEAEDNISRRESDICWIIDPIDGTKEFIKQTNEFCVMIGICYKGEPSYGVINIPMTEEIFLGGEGFGLTLKKDGQVTKLPEIDRSGPNVLVSRSHRKDIVLPYIESKGLNGISCGSSGVKACRLIDQTAHHYIHGTVIHEWDVAAADALVRAAGGYFTDISGQKVTYNKLVPEVNGVIASFSKDYVNEISEFFAERVSF